MSATSRPLYKNLTIEVGATFAEGLGLTTNVGANAALNLTGFTGTGKLRKSYYSDYNVYPLTITINNASTGAITLSATAAETALFKPGRYVYDVEMTFGATVLRVLEGIIDVKPNSTK